jgi:hypothetical protein
MQTWELVQELEEGVEKIRALISILASDLADGLKEGGSE